MTAELLLGIDVGTTSCKAAVVDLDGEEKAHGKHPTPWTPVPTGAEIDPRAMAEAAVAAALDAIAAAPAGRILGVGVCSMGETGVMLDDRGEPMAPGIAWHDERGGTQADLIGRELGARVFGRRTGLPLGPFWTAPKLLALRGSDPGIGNGRRWLSVAEWIVRALGGEEVAELSLASRTGLLDVTSRAWWPEAFDLLGLPPRIMPPLVPAGTPAGRVTAVPELRGAVLTVGGHDHPCAAPGAGVTSSTDTFDSCGTAEALLRGASSPVPLDDVERAVGLNLTAGCHVLPGQQVLMGFFKAGFALKRFLGLLGSEEIGEARNALDRAALEAPPGAGGLRIARLAEKEADVIGVGAEASPGLLWRAVLEAGAAESAAILSAIEEVAGRSERVVVAGGWARSEAFREVKRSVCGPFDYPIVREAGARGAALFAGLAAGVFPSVDGFPRPSLHRV